MPMRVRLAWWIVGSMRVLMVLVVHVPMRVLHRLVLMLVLMDLGDVQPDADRHEQSSNGELGGH